jgi:hypothetical protein
MNNVMLVRGALIGVMGAARRTAGSFYSPIVPSAATSIFVVSIARNNAMKVGRVWPNPKVRDRC